MNSLLQNLLLKLRAATEKLLKAPDGSISLRRLFILALGLMIALSWALALSGWVIPQFIFSGLLELLAQLLGTQT